MLITGESGSGKELLAREIHRLSCRSGGPFLAQNCSCIPDTLLESELFGHEKGAFTGAFKTKPGLFEAANKGTVFLDEIGDMPLQLQARILRVIQDGEIKPIGNARPKKVNVRIISATNRDLQSEIARENFREDLFYRLNVLPLHVPRSARKAGRHTPSSGPFFEQGGAPARDHPQEVFRRGARFSPRIRMAGKRPGA